MNNINAQWLRGALLVMFGEVEDRLKEDTMLPQGRPEYNAAWVLGYTAAIRELRQRLEKAEDR